MVCVVHKNADLTFKYRHSRNSSCCLFAVIPAFLAIDRMVLTSDAKTRDPAPKSVTSMASRLFNKAIRCCSMTLYSTYRRRSLTHCCWNSKTKGEWMPWRCRDLVKNLRYARAIFSIGAGLCEDRFFGESWIVIRYSSLILNSFLFFRLTIND